MAHQTHCVSNSIAFDGLDVWLTVSARTSTESIQFRRVVVRVRGDVTTVHADVVCDESLARRVSMRYCLWDLSADDYIWFSISVSGACEKKAPKGSRHKVQDRLLVGVKG